MVMAKNFSQKNLAPAIPRERNIRSEIVSLPKLINSKETKHVSAVQLVLSWSPCNISEVVVIAFIISHIGSHQSWWPNSPKRHNSVYKQYPMTYVRS